jgi:hypothetical protein
MYVGGCCALYTGIYDFLIPSPSQKPHFLDFKEKKERKIVVVGAGFTGMSTAYFLSKNPKNKIEILEQKQNAYDARENIYGPIIAPNFAEPMTYISLRKMIRGIVKADTPNSIFIMDNLKQAGVWRFLRFWLFSNTKKSRSDKILIMKRLLNADEKLLNELIKDKVLPAEALSP